jgi:cytochrome c oxidase cbb3-type subunit 3
MKLLSTWTTAGLSIVLLGCGHKTEQFTLPDHVSDFEILYAANCSGCHGPDGRSGAARALHDPLFLVLIGKKQLRDVVANGVRGTAMPAFAQESGGALTDQQIDILADRMEAVWARPQETIAVAFPPYRADSGDAKRGEDSFHRYCARCHGEDGMIGAIANPAFLALVSDQSLRTTVIAGRAGQGCPDWRGYVPGHVLAPQEIADVVAWLGAHRSLPGSVAEGGANLK